MRIVLTLATAFGVATSLGADLERSLGSQKLRTLPDAYSASYTFRSFKHDDLTIDFKYPKQALAQYESKFGYYQKDLDAIKAWHNDARQGAYKLAIKTGKSQKDLDNAMKNLQAENDRRVKEYMASRGFRLMPGNVVLVDMPGVVKRNGPVLNALAKAFDDIAQEQGYDTEDTIGAAVSMVQTALEYQEPPTIDGDHRHTGGILQPATALVKGWGDCDTKTGLLASILSNWPKLKMVGVGVPGHYLMAVLRSPRKGDVFVEFQGLQYVLIEPAGPAWLEPGTVADSSIALLENTDGYRIDPFFN
jgi:hypothetical protein